MDRPRVPSDRPSDSIGYSRAIRVGNVIEVCGTAPITRDGTVIASGDMYGQAKACLEIIVAALAELGASAEDVIRTRVFLTDASRWREAGRAHGEILGHVRPASTFVQVAGLLDPAWLLEIEATAVLD